MKTRFFLLIYIPVLLIVSTIGIWFFEYVLTGNPDSAFNNLFSSLWWTVQTVTTLGYGDLTPITLGGQLFSILVVAAGLLQLALIISLVSDRLVSFRGAKERGLAEVQMQNHILVCSDDIVFIHKILEENRSFVSQQRLVLVCPFDKHPMESDPFFQQIPWVSGDAYRYRILQKANAQKAFIAYVCLKDDSHSLMTVMQIEQLTNGEAVTMVQYQGLEKQQLFEDVGCDHAVNPYQLQVPMMVSAYTSRGSSWWILQLILQGDYTRYGSIYQKGTPSLENHELSHDDVGKSWLELTEEWKRHKQMLPMGLMEGNTVRINPDADFTLFEELRVLALVPPKERPDGDDTTDSIDYQGDAEVAVSGNILICSDNPVFLESILRELSYLENLAEIVVISEVDPEEVNQGRLEVDWIRECSYSLEAFKLAQASDANVAFVDHEHDGLTLIAVLELERISGGTIFTVASYREDDFDQQLIKAGCDFCINTLELTAPLLSQTSAHPGTGVLIESIISGQPPSERIFSRQFNKKWVPRTWIETLLELKKEYSYLPLGLIRAYDRRMLCNPNNDVMVEPGDTLLFMAKSEEERDLEIFLPGRFALHDPNRKEELDDRQAALLAEAEELFKQGVLLSRKQDGAQEAYQLFHEAAIKGFSRAKYNLGILNFHGKGVPRNVDEAYYWFQEAAVEGNEPARKALDSIKTLRESEEQFKNSEKELNMVQMDHLTEDQRFWYAKAITKIILADGRIDLYERVYLHGAIHILEDPDHVREIEESILLKREINLGNVFGLSDKDQERILNELVEIATVDRDFDIEEQEMLREIGNAMGSSRKSIQKTIDQGLEKVRQYQKR